MSTKAYEIVDEAPRIEDALTNLTITTKDKVCPQLPIEIWAQIFAHTEPFALWIDCRRVSNLFRHEAEKACASIHLPHLRIRWAYEGRIMQCEHAAMISYQGRAYLGDFVRVDGDRAYFKLQVHRDAHYTPRLPEPDPELDEHYVGYMFPKMMAYRDVDYPLRFGNMVEPTIAQAAWLDGHFNDVEMHDVEYVLENEEVSFDWKTFFNLFYGDYAFVRQKCGFDVVYAAEQYLEQKIAPSIGVPGSKMDHWIQNFGKNENGYFWKAYLERLERSHEKVGKKLYEEKVDPKLAQNILSRVAQTQRERNSLIFKNFLQQRNIQRIEDSESARARISRVQTARVLVP